VQHYQEWLYRIGLAGLALVAAVFGVRMLTNPSHSGSDVSAGPVSTVPVDGESTSTTADALSPFSIVSLANGAHVTTPFVTLNGVAKPGATISAATASATVGPDGQWVLSVNLTPGPNTVVVTSKDASGESSITLTITYDPPPETTAPPAPPPTTARPASGGGTHPTTHPPPTTAQPTTTQAPATTTTQAPPCTRFCRP
jgi:hypothetical protein